ncbi:hypothetical protein ARMSODRAFT_877181 [Armillaria solidipes]|uniref:Uncharacterized protein n=1 Tax=Armillaria solidipes TaxID=1076256 RepID=A0A2H3BWZ8_9AGAR|nr:hypothetical protein ARMSODRAFT_877181 [Armillaria solidipes]
MFEDTTTKSWGIFEETEIFIAACQHSCILKAADMVQSGELSKYPQSIVKHLLDVLGEDLGIGYDIRCQFQSMLKRLPCV